jgi:hypothetical protein
VRNVDVGFAGCFFAVVAISCDFSLGLTIHWLDEGEPACVTSPLRAACISWRRLSGQAGEGRQQGTTVDRGALTAGYGLELAAVSHAVLLANNVAVRHDSASVSGCPIRVGKITSAERTNGGSGIPRRCPRDVSIAALRREIRNSAGQKVSRPLTTLGTFAADRLLLWCQSIHCGALGNSTSVGEGSVMQTLRRQPQSLAKTTAGNQQGGHLDFRCEGGHPANMRQGAQCRHSLLTG